MKPDQNVNKTTDMVTIICALYSVKTEITLEKALSGLEIVFWRAPIKEE